MKVFDEKVTSCRECFFSQKASGCYPVYNCNKSGEVILYNIDKIHHNCPFKTENSFTDEQFRSIGFIRDKFMGLYKTASHKGIEYKHGIMVHKDTITLVMFVNNPDFTKSIMIKKTSFPHLKFILESLI